MIALVSHAVNTLGNSCRFSGKTSSHRWNRLLLLGTLVTLVGVTGCRRELPVDVAASPQVVDQLRELLGAGVEPGEREAPVLAEPTGFADFKGVFRIDGQAPTMPPIVATGSEVSICFPDGQLPRRPDVVVGPNNELANVLIYVDMALPMEWEHDDYVAEREALLAAEDGFDQIGCMFTSRIFPMRSTQRVELLNSDNTGHNTNIAATGRARTYNAIIPALSKAEYSPGGESRGPFSVTCNIHPWMLAYMIVRDNPYFAVTDEEGRFEIKNLPAGIPLTFRVWQEQVQNNFVDVTINQGATRWSRGRFDLTFEPDSTEEWEVVVDAAIFQ
jgi:hypothetical protein